MFRFLSVFGIVVFLQACGSVTPMPSHGGGKRFAVEQQLISAAAKKAVSALPVEPLRGKKGFVTTSIIFDEGGGVMNGGRPSVAEVLGGKLGAGRAYSGGDATSVQTRSRTAEIGGAVSTASPNYSKDFVLNGSDGRHLINLFSSYLQRNNVIKNPNPETDGAADFVLEIIVDVFGTVWKRTDWGLNNSESLSAIVSYEYVITPLKDEYADMARVGVVSFEAKYVEDYLLWVGPTQTRLSVMPSDVGQMVGDLGPLSLSHNALQKKSPEFIQPEQSAVQINPGRR